MTPRGWTTREIKDLESLARMGYRDPEIATLLRRTRLAIQRKRLDLGIESLVSKNALARNPVMLWLYVSRDFDSKIREFCAVHGSSVADFLESLASNFMESLSDQPEEIKNVEAAE